MKTPKITLDEAKAKVAGMNYEAVKAVLRSHGMELWMDNERILRTILAEKITDGEIKDPTITSDTVITT